MKLAYFDCFAGAGGDMIVGALLDAGADMEAVKEALGRLNVPGFSVLARTVQRAGLAGLKFDVAQADGEHHHRGLSEILSAIEAAGLPGRAGENASRIFTRLGEAEARVHGIEVERVHFHEVGAIDSIADVVAACVALETLNVRRVLCSPIPLGSGTVACAHGELPVPSPATAHLAGGAKVVESDLSGYATTPTAAAVLTTLAEGFGPIPAMVVQAVGYGAGAREGGVVPNLLRVFIGIEGDGGEVDSAVELSANVDDCTGEIIGATIERLLSAGCLDAWVTPIVMKKSRPAWMLSALCGKGDVAAIERIIFTETTTFGIRRRPCRRSKLQRHCRTVETP